MSSNQKSAPADGSVWRRMPGWVRIFLIGFALALALMAVMLLAGHGPGRHFRHQAPTPTTGTAP